MNKKSFHVFLLIAYLAVLCWLCFGKFDSVTASFPRYTLGIPTDKIVHFIMFLPFPLLCWLVFRGRSGKPWHSLVLVLIFFGAGCLLAAGTELGQTLIAYRAGDPGDFLADGIAIAFSTVIALILDIRFSLRKAASAK